MQYKDICPSQGLGTLDKKQSYRSPLSLLWLCDRVLAALALVRCFRIDKGKPIVNSSSHKEQHHEERLLFGEREIWIPYSLALAESVVIWQLRRKATYRWRLFSVFRIARFGAEERRALTVEVLVGPPIHTVSPFCPRSSACDPQSGALLHSACKVFHRRRTCDVDSICTLDLIDFEKAFRMTLDYS
jgi:hypothetical protein